MTAALQLNRIVQIVAEGSRLPDGGEMPIDDLARRHGVSAKQIQEDVRVLTLLGDHAESDWLLSLEVWQEQDRVRVASRGPWRRPLRFTPDELAVLRIALATDPEGLDLVERLNVLDRRPPEEPKIGIDVPAALADHFAAIREATHHCHKLEIFYAGSSDRMGKTRIIHVHQLFGYRGSWFAKAWCESAKAWRHFRVDRMVKVKVLKEKFVLREDSTRIEDSDQVFQADADSLEDVRVRFSPSVARWAKENYAGHKAVEGGAVDVVFQTASPQWLARHLLQYGTEAEVMEPEAYREAVREAVG